MSSKDISGIALNLRLAFAVETLVSRRYLAGAVQAESLGGAETAATYQTMANRPRR